LVAEPVSGGPGEHSSLRASVTPIGALLEQSEPLHLTVDQVGKLEALDQSLAARNDQLDSELHLLELPPDPGEREAHGSSADRARLLDERATNLRNAIERALATLRPDQQGLARSILGERDTAGQ
jgi:hypothetical protein